MQLSLPCPIRGFPEDTDPIAPRNDQVQRKSNQHSEFFWGCSTNLEEARLRSVRQELRNFRFEKLSAEMSTFDDDEKDVPWSIS